MCRTQKVFQREVKDNDDEYTKRGMAEGILYAVKNTVTVINYVVLSAAGPK